MKKILIAVSVTVIIAAIVLLNMYKVEKKKDERYDIVATFYPIYIALLNITEGAKDITVSNLTKDSTGCIHDYTITTSEIRSVADADVLVMNGLSMEPFMDKITENYPNLKIVDSSKNIPVIKEEHEGEEEVNSHIFVSIEAHIKQVENISSELSSLNPENSQIYAANTKKYVAKLGAEKEKITTALAGVKNKNIVTFHDAFAYFAKEFGLNVVGVIEGEHDEQPSAINIAEVIDAIKENNVKVIVANEEYNQDVADTVAVETDARVYLINPVTSGENDKDGYINIIKNNLQTLVEGL